MRHGLVMVEEFEQDICAVIGLDNDCKPEIFCAVALMSWCRFILLWHMPAEKSYVCFSLFLYRGQQSGQDYPNE